MRYGVLLIGFEYVLSDRWKTLPGISTDLYQVYSYVKNITKNIMLFTDIDQDYNTSILQRAILDGYVDSGLLSFIEDIKDRKQHTLYSSTVKNSYTVNNFDQTVTNFVAGLDRLIIYYTGHGKNGDIILPDNTHVSLIYLKELMCENVNQDCQIILILDCCESNGLNLPYQYIMCENTMKKDINWCWKLYSHDFTEKEILCISSSRLHEDSTATKTGSLFTKILFGYLSYIYNKYILLADLSNNIKGIYIYGSYPEIKMVWGWFTKSIHNNIDITVDNNSSIITVKLNDCQSTIDKSSSIKNYLRYHHTNRYKNY
jgi:hypothetical protein